MGLDLCGQRACKVVQVSGLDVWHTSWNEKMSEADIQP